VTYVLAPSQCQSIAEVGGKAAKLAVLHSAGLPVPDWFALSSRAFDDSLAPDVRASMAAGADLADSSTGLTSLRPSREVCTELSRALQRLCPNGELVAVRSSGIDEDGGGYTFAGLFETCLCVRPEHVLQAVVTVWRSGFSGRVVAYRRAQGLPLPNRPPAVVVQRQIDPEAAGVAFGADPVSGRRAVAVVGAVYGLGHSLVSGQNDGDTFHVSRDGRILARVVAVKRIAYRCGCRADGGWRACPVPEDDAGKPALDDSRVKEVAGLARHAGQQFGWPQDIEWAIERGRLYLLQSRPMTALGLVADPDGVLNVWDNSNVVESYGGVTLPLTFSFARHVYAEVYREFCRLVGVPPHLIAAHHATFGRMLGIVRGRVFYNLLSWYRLLATLPGFTLNRRFMEQMMGVAEGVPDHVLAERRSATAAARALDALRVGRTALGLITSHFLRRRRLERFRHRLDGALEPTTNLEESSADDTVADYRLLERQLLKRWDAPLVNDFFAMIFYGVLRRLAQKWCDDRDGTLQNDLIAGEGGVISTEPAERVLAMARIAQAHPELATALCHGSLGEIAERLAQTPSFTARYDEYLHRFGDRCFEELKLESRTVSDDPLTLLRSIGQLALGTACVEATGRDRAPGRDTRSDPRSVRRQAEEQVRPLLARQPHRRIIFDWVLKHARARVRDRENLRFDRTRVFGKVRRIFLALGRHFEGLGVLAAAGDIFYLQVDEVLGFVEGTAVTTDLKALVAVRKAEYVQYVEGPPPDDRFETHGVVYVGNSFRRAVPDPEGGDERRGIGCCPGIVEGNVSIVLDPRKAVLSAGVILVAERTDPAWVVLFRAAAGLLVERGSVLSHSAIIAREMGIPTIVAIPGLTKWIRGGDRVRLDGRTGIVRRITEGPEGRDAR